MDTNVLEMISHSNTCVEFKLPTSIDKKLLFRISSAKKLWKQPKTMFFFYCFLQQQYSFNTPSLYS